VIDFNGAPVRTKLRTHMLLKLRYDSSVFRTRSVTPSIEASLSRFASRSNAPSRFAGFDFRPCTQVARRGKRPARASGTVAGIFLAVMGAGVLAATTTPMDLRDRARAAGLG
jgi:hypothetical protein